MAIFFWRTRSSPDFCTSFQATYYHFIPSFISIGAFASHSLATPRTSGFCGPPIPSTQCNASFRCTTTTRFSAARSITPWYTTYQTQLSLPQSHWHSAHNSTTSIARTSIFLASNHNYTPGGVIFHASANARPRSRPCRLSYTTRFDCCREAFHDLLHSQHFCLDTTFSGG